VLALSVANGYHEDSNERNPYLMTPATVLERTDVRKKQVRGLAIEAIANKQLDAYEAADKMVVWMQENHYALGTIFKYRSYLPKLYRFCKVSFEQSVYNENVRLVRKLTETQSKTPSPEFTKQLLENPLLRTRVLVAATVSTYARINEIVQLKLSDLNLELKPARVIFRSTTTKTGKERTCFLCTRAAELVRQFTQYRIQRGDGWIFPGRRKDHLTAKSAAEAIMQALHRIGLTEKSAKTGRYAYHPHVFRRLGMNISKRAKFPWDWVEWLAGHEIGTQEAYLPTVDEAAETWNATVEPKMTAYLSGNLHWVNA
jgi:integrase